MTSERDLQGLPPLVASLRIELERLTDRQTVVGAELQRLSEEHGTNARDIEYIQRLLSTRGYNIETERNDDDAKRKLGADADEDEGQSLNTPLREGVTTRVATLALLASEKRDFSVQEIIKRLPEFGSSAQEVTIRSYIVRMQKANQIEKGDDRGTYRLPADVSDVARATLRDRLHLVAHEPDELPLLRNMSGEVDE